MGVDIYGLGVYSDLALCEIEKIPKDQIKYDQIFKCVFSQTDDVDLNEAVLEYIILKHFPQFIPDWEGGYT